MVERLTSILGACAIALCGANAPQAHAQQVKEKAVGYKRIGAVSVTADKLIRYYVGVTVFGNEHEEKDVASWELDKEFAEQLGKAGALVFGATYISAPHSAPDFANANDARVLEFKPDQVWMTEKIGAAAQRYCDANGHDAILVASKHDRSDIWGSRQRMGAMGIVSKSNPFGDPFSFAYVSSRISLYDCRDGLVVGTRLLGYVSDEKPSEPGMRLRRVPPDVAKLAPSRWDDAAAAKARTALMEAPGPSWDQTVRAIVSPPDDARPASGTTGMTP